MLVVSTFFKDTSDPAAMMQDYEYPGMAPLNKGLLQVGELGTGA